MVVQKTRFPEKISDFWADWMRWEFANRPNLISREIQEQAEELAKAWPQEEGHPSPGKAPGLRTIYKYRDAYHELPEYAQRAYQPFRWPTSMEQGLLSWEASSRAIELLTWCQDQELWAPPISLTNWFYRISLVIPKAPLGERLRVAQTVASYREAEQDVPADVVQLLISPDLRTDHRAHIITGGPTAAWATQFVWNRSARDALYE